MLILDKDGSAKRFFYKGNGMFDGKLFSSNELLKFAIEILTSEYQNRDIEVTDINYNIDCRLPFFSDHSKLEFQTFITKFSYSIGVK